MLSTYPPKLCGLATFAAALSTHLHQVGHRVDLVQIDDGDHRGEPAAIRRSPGRVAVAGRLLNGSASSVRSAAGILSQADVAIIQHEYGIFGGPDGDEVLDLIDALTVPAVVVLHTVPLHPSPHQQSVLEDICARVQQVVV
ncbi:MAG: glycosyl transferase family 1, partial [Actinomycetota bacterium]